MTLDFSQYRVTQKPELPDEGPDIGRHALRSGARIGETLLGLPGDIEATVVPAINWVAKQTKKHLGFGKPRTEEEIAEGQFLPTSRKLKEFSEKASKGYLSPQTEAEQAADEYLELATSLAVPGPKTLAGKKVFQGIKKAGSLAGLASGTKHGLKALGVDEDSANIASFAALAVPGLLKARNPRQTVNALYAEANEALPKGAAISAQKIDPAMKNFLTDLRKGTATPSKSAAIRAAEDILEKSKSGLIEVEELMAFKRDINELMKDPHLLRRGEKFLPKIGHEIDQLIDAYGKHNPEFIQKYRLANQMFGGIEQSAKAVNFLGRYEKYIKNPYTLAALGLLKPSAIPGTLEAYAVGKTAQKSYEVLHRIFKNPALRKFYGNIVKEASKENAKGMIQFLKKFDQKIDEEFPDFEQYKVSDQS